MTKLKVYALREFGRSAWLPRDLLDALDEPPNHRQGQILIWATTASNAYRHLETLGLGGVVRSSRELGQAMSYDVQILDAAHPWPEHTVLITNSFGTGPVAEVVRQAGDGPEGKRRARVIGHLDRPERPIFTPADLAMAVTDAMVKAALKHLPLDLGLPATDLMQHVRNALAAALKAQRGQE